MRRGVLLLLLGVAISLLGCQHVPKPATTTNTLNLGGEGVVSAIWARDQCPQVGDIITLRASVTNETSKMQVYDSKDQPVLDLIVTTRGTGGVTTRWSDGKALTPDLTHLELQPGQNKTIEMDLKVSPNNTYSVEAAFSYSAKFPPLMPYVSINDVQGCSINLP